jgi:hypothetical protein
MAIARNYVLGSKQYDLAESLCVKGFNLILAWAFFFVPDNKIQDKIAKNY